MSRGRNTIRQRGWRRRKGTWRDGVAHRLRRRRASVTSHRRRRTTTTSRQSNSRKAPSRTKPRPRTPRLAVAAKRLPSTVTTPTTVLRQSLRSSGMRQREARTSLSRRRWRAPPRSSRPSPPFTRFQARSILSLSLSLLSAPDIFLKRNDWHDPTLPYYTHFPCQGPLSVSLLSSWIRNLSNVCAFKIQRPVFCRQAYTFMTLFTFGTLVDPGSCSRLFLSVRAPLPV